MASFVLGYDSHVNTLGYGTRLTFLSMWGKCDFLGYGIWDTFERSWIWYTFEVLGYGKSVTLLNTGHV